MGKNFGTHLLERMDEGEVFLSPWSGGMVIGKRGAPMFVPDQTDPFTSMVQRFDDLLGKKVNRFGQWVNFGFFDVYIRKVKTQNKIGFRWSGESSAHERLKFISEFGTLAQNPIKPL